MLRGNLATRPFYNERVATFAITAAAVLVVVLTAFNVSELVRLSTERQRVQGQLQRDQTDALRIRQSAASSRQAVDRAVLARLALSTRQANDLIDQRTFSWTSFFAVIERTLPADVRLIQVSPRVEQGTFRVTMTVVARALSDVGTFIEALRGSGVFHTVAAVDQQTRDDGTYGATIEAEYAPSGGANTEQSTGGVR